MSGNKVVEDEGDSALKTLEGIRQNYLALISGPSFQPRQGLEVLADMAEQVVEKCENLGEISHWILGQIGKYAFESESDKREFLAAIRAENKLAPLAEAYGRSHRRKLKWESRLRYYTLWMAILKRGVNANAETRVNETWKNTEAIEISLGGSILDHPQFADEEREPEEGGKGSVFEVANYIAGQPGLSQLHW